MWRNPMNIFKAKTPLRTTRFSEFIRNASSSEKKRVYNAVLKQATAEQNAVLLKAKELESSKKRTA